MWKSDQVTDSIQNTKKKNETTNTETANQGKKHNTNSVCENQSNYSIKRRKERTLKRRKPCTKQRNENLKPIRVAKTERPSGNRTFILSTYAKSSRMDKDRTTTIHQQKPNFKKPDKTLNQTKPCTHPPIRSAVPAVRAKRLRLATGAMRAYFDVFWLYACIDKLPFVDSL